jgi:hypothetical protein
MWKKSCDKPSIVFSTGIRLITLHLAYIVTHLIYYNINETSILPHAVLASHGRKCPAIQGLGIILESSSTIRMFGISECIYDVYL